MNKKLAPLALGLLSFFAMHAHAEIFKCKDGKGKIAYQETPCPTTTVGKMGYVPDLPLQDQMRAQARANEQKSMVRQIEATEEARRHEGEAARSRHIENQRQFALEQESEKKRQEEKKQMLEKSGVQNTCIAYLMVLEDLTAFNALQPASSGQA